MLQSHNTVEEVATSAILCENILLCKDLVLYHSRACHFQPNYLALIPI